MEHLVIIPLWILYEIYACAARKWRQEKKWRDFLAIPVIYEKKTTIADTQREMDAAWELHKATECLPASGQGDLEEDHIF